MVQMNLGQAWSRLGEVRGDPALLWRAAEAFEAASRGFSRQGLAEETQEALQAAQEARRTLARRTTPPPLRCGSECPNPARENAP